AGDFQEVAVGALEADEEARVTGEGGGAGGDADGGGAGEVDEVIVGAGELRPAAGDLERVVLASLAEVDVVQQRAAEAGVAVAGGPDREDGVAGEAVLRAAAGAGV